MIKTQWQYGLVSLPCQTYVGSVDEVETAAQDDADNGRACSLDMFLIDPDGHYWVAADRAKGVISWSQVEPEEQGRFAGMLTEEGW
jgi:hypothetical protein